MATALAGPDGEPYAAAVALAYCAAAVAADDRIPADRRLARSRDLAERAVAQLRRSVSAGEARPEELANEVECILLRDRFDFRVLAMDAVMPDDPFAR